MGTQLDPDLSSQTLDYISDARIRQMSVLITRLQKVWLEFGA